MIVLGRKIIKWRDKNALKGGCLSALESIIREGSWGWWHPTKAWRTWGKQPCKDLEEEAPGRDKCKGPEVGNGPVWQMVQGESKMVGGSQMVQDLVVHARTFDSILKPHKSTESFTQRCGMIWFVLFKDDSVCCMGKDSEMNKSGSGEMSGEGSRATQIGEYGGLTRGGGSGKGEKWITWDRLWW